MAKGLEFLHARRIVHLDLKSPNILLGHNLRAKIADVGIARALTGSHISTITSSGTFHWASPELLLGSKVTEMVSPLFRFPATTQALPCCYPCWYLGSTELVC